MIRVVRKLALPHDIHFFVKRGSIMKANVIIGIAKFLFNSRLYSSAVSLALLVVGIALSSASLLIAAGILAYGWPFFHVYFKDMPETVEKAPAKRLDLAPSQALVNAR
jgi:hypothetical protein